MMWREKRCHGRICIADGDHRNNCLVRTNSIYHFTPLNIFSYNLSCKLDMFTCIYPCLSSFHTQLVKNERCQSKSKQKFMLLLCNIGNIGFVCLVIWTFYHTKNVLAFFNVGFWYPNLTLNSHEQMF